MRAKKCKGCGGLFTPQRSLQSACSVLCAIIVANEKKEKAVKKKNREQKEGLKTKPKLTSEAQVYFNKYIRLRDSEENCISCDRHDSVIDYFGVGGKWDCGHYLSVGSNPELRFEEDNAHRQCKSCNGGSGKYARKGRTVSEGYRIHLIERIGIERVEWLEGPHEMPNWTHDDLRQIKKKYMMKARDLRKALECA